MRNIINKSKLKDIIKAISYGTAIFFSLYLIISGLVTSEFSIFGMIGTIVGLLMSGWNLFDKSLWKYCKPSKLPGSLKTPALYGRWVGEIIREGKKHAFVLEVKQTYTDIMCTTYTQNSTSNSLLAEILLINDTYQLIYFWDGETKSTLNNEDRKSPRFYGCTKLIYDSTNLTLIGNYFTDRTPYQTKGDVILKFESEKCINCFKKS